MTRRDRRTFTQDFKTKIVNLYLGGKNKADILRDYNLHDPTLDRWIKQHEYTGTFKEKDNYSLEVIELRKRNQQLEKENDILKPAR